MATQKSQWLVTSDLRRGRNGNDPPHALADNECADAVNVDWHQCMIARKRGGSDALSMTGSTFTGKISSMGRHVPASDSTAAELWAVDDAATPVINRLAAGTTWSAPTLKDNPTGNGWDFSMASSGGKFFMAYKSAQGRLHCWDGSTVRRTGLAVPAVPTVANTAAGGGYTATLRYYRVRYTIQVTGITTRRSEPSTSVAFTPSGTKSGVEITKPASISEDETHWELEVSLDNASFFVLATTVVGTTLYTDTASTVTYGSNTVSPTIGLYTVQPSYRFVAVDQSRLLGLGDYTATGKQNRIEFSDILGDLNISDNERVPLGSYVDLDENDSGAATGLIGPVLGSYFAFKETQTWKLTPSGNPTVPYTQTAISKTIGAVAHSMVVGEDEYGNPAIYWVSHRGMYRYGSNGLEYIGAGVSDLIIGPTSTINLAASKVVAHGVYHSKLRQAWMWIAVGSENEPQSMKVVYNIGRYGGFVAPTSTQAPSGWSRHTGEQAKARCSVMFSETVAASMSKDMKPYIGQSGANNTIWKTDTTATTDAGTAFQAYITTKAFNPGDTNNIFVNRSWLLGKSLSGASIQQTLAGDFGNQTPTTDSVLLTPTGSETWVSPRFEDSRIGDVGYLQVTWGDAAAVASGSWQIDQSTIEYIVREVP